MALRGLVGVVCLGASWAILSGRTCHASCGDYVVLKGSHANMPAEDQASPASAPKRTPCNSPACRGEVPLVPVPAAPLSGGPSEKPLALFELSLYLEGGSPGCDWLPASEQTRSGFRSPLERPPSF
jgi:hypothetical protein